MSDVTPQLFEHGQDVIDTQTGRIGQIRFIVWETKREVWLYCISRKDIDDEESWVEESYLKAAPAQTRIDKKSATVLYAPRRLKHQQRLPPYVKKPAPIKDKDGYSRFSNRESWLSRPLIGRQETFE